MSHNIHTEPCAGGDQEQTVLTVREGDQHVYPELQISFQPHTSKACQPHLGRLVIRVTPEQGAPYYEQACVAGEDLYALRALLAEMPESAFVEPAPSVVTPDLWIDGDVITKKDSGLFYVRQDGQWRVFGPTSNPRWRGSDDEMDTLSKSSRIEIVIRGGKEVSK